MRQRKRMLLSRFFAFTTGKYSKPYWWPRRKKGN